MTKEKLFEKLDIFLPVVKKVHGKHHEEIFKVDDEYNQIKENIGRRDRLVEIFNNIRQLTNNYEIPDDVCESYEEVYNMLEELERVLK